MVNPNLQLLTDAAKLLEPLLGELVFVGGCATALLITDNAAADVRPTFDVDAIAEITSYAEYTEFSERLRKLGFQEDTREGAPLCRWRQHTTTLDVMPLDAKILGFSNSWYRPAMDHAEERELENFTITWNALEGLVAVVAGAIAGSILLVGFGIDSFIEVTSGLTVEDVR
jgi:hypothetical protein